MDLELRTIREEEMPDFLRAAMTGFGMTGPDPDGEFPFHLLPAERSLSVFDDGAMVATAGAYPFRIRVPGGARVAVAGVTVVSVHPTHRRRGLLRSMMDEQLDDVARRGEPLAALTASEASIYERFGYGIATAATRWELDSEHARLVAPQDASGSVRLVEGSAAMAAARAVYDAAVATRVGEIERVAEWWDAIFAPERKGAKFFTAVHEAADGHPDAFARYTIDEHWPEGVPASTLRVLEIHGAGAEAEAALWGYLFGIDLIGTVKALDRPVDDPLRWRLPDPRRMRVRELRDHLWVRVVDVAAALGARTYGVEDALVIELVDPFRPANSGRWRVEGGPGGATCAPTDTDPDLELAAPDLGALYLGGVAASTLAAAQRVEERTDGALRRADQFFGVQPLPWCTTHF
ncbi:MAG: GNAT family N-acetyltransferase [Acidimicrobiia bacterium]